MNGLPGGVPRHTFVLGALACAALVVVGAFLNWATASLGAFSVSVRGTEADGTITLTLAIVGAVLLLFSKGKRGMLIGAAVSAVLIALVALIDVFDVPAAGNGVVDTSVAIGLWITLLAGVLWTALSILLVRGRASIWRAEPAVAADGDVPTA